MDVTVKFNQLWNLPIAKRIMASLEIFDPFWFEDSIRMNNATTRAELSRSTRVPIAARATLATRCTYRELLEHRATGIVMPDFSWVGGMWEGGKVASMTEAEHLPIVPHDCTGPRTYVASAYLAMKAPNTLMQGSLRVFYSGWYRKLLTQLPRVMDGYIHPMEESRLGMRLLPDLVRRPDARVRRSKL